MATPSSRRGTAAGRQEGAAAAGDFRVRFDNNAIQDMIHNSNGPVAKDLLRRAIQVERRAKQLAPVDTGRLRASITHALEGTGRARNLSAVVGTSVNYARYVEFGTSRMAPRSFLRAAVAATKGLRQLPQRYR